KANSVAVEVLDTNGKLVRKLTSKKEGVKGKEEEEDDDEEEEGEESSDKTKARTVLPRTAGVHRVVWDLRHEGAPVIKKAKVDAGQIRRGQLALPGTYTLKLTTGG